MPDDKESKEMKKVMDAFLKDVAALQKKGAEIEKQLKAQKDQERLKLMLEIMTNIGRARAEIGQAFARNARG